VRGPAAIIAYLRGHWHGLGHNPLGALSVLGLLTVLGLQAAADSSATTTSPFRARSTLVSKDTSDWMTGLHRKGFWLVLVLVATHLAAIVFYLRARATSWWPDADRPQACRQPDAPKPAHGGGAVALIFALAVGWPAAYGASGAWQPPPRPRRPLPGLVSRNRARGLRLSAELLIRPCGTCRGRPCRTRRSCRTGP
jgi:hypothetical protein